MINYFNFKKFKDEFLITNDFGRYDFLSKNEFKTLIKDDVLLNDEVKKRLEDKMFIYDTSSLSFAEKAAYRYIDSKNYLFKGTQLHIFVVTTKCNQQCIYCQAQNGHCIPEGMMAKETAQKAVDIALQSPANTLDFEFQGGEPLLNFEIIKYIVEYSNAVKKDKNINYSIVSNLTLLNDEILNFILEYKITLSTSLDGNDIVHNHNRPYRKGNKTYFDVDKKIEEIRKRDLFIGALETTTAFSLDKWKDIVDSYVDHGFNNISLRPLTQLGSANANWKAVGYSPEDFVSFYRNAFKYIIEINRNGYRLVEGQAAIILKKVLTGFSENYMELRSPCGAALGQTAYYYDGNIYTCDEGRMLAEMGDDSFKLGNVFTDSYDSLMNSNVCKSACSASILEALPSCSDCVYQPYCGTCPVVTYAHNQDLYEKSVQEYHCKVNMGILDTIFGYLKTNDNEIMNMFWSWIN